MITQQDIERFGNDGVVCLRGLFDQHWLDKLAAGVEKNFKDPGPFNTVYTRSDSPGSFYDDYCNWQRIEEYQEFIQHSPAAEIAARLTCSVQARIYHEHVLVKEPGTREPTPWHHDLPYYGVDGNQLCSIWLPLDPVPRNVCPEFVLGSHNTGALYYPRFFLTSENYADGVPGFETIPDIESNRQDYTISSWELQPGDCLVFHMRTLHGAPSTSDLKFRRRAFSSRWLGDDARFSKRAWKTSPPYPEVELEHGDAMAHASFPIMWSRE